MLILAIENSYNNKNIGNDTFGARFFMQEMFYKQWIELVRVSINNFNRQTWYFSEYWILDNNGKNIIINRKIKPNILWIRKFSYSWYKYDTFKNFILVPWIKIATIGNDKMENFKFLEKYQPVSYLLSSFIKSPSIQNSIWDRLIIKPIRANGWKWIRLVNKKDLINNSKKYEWLGELFIVQEFKDFSKWFWNITKWIHDLRFMFAWKKIIEITLREPKKWDFRSNIWSGGKQIFLDKSQIPKDLLSLAKNIYRDIDIADNNIFSMDFAYCKKENKWYLLEINSSPWTRFYQKDKNVLKKIFKWLADFFITLTNE